MDRNQITLKDKEAIDLTIKLLTEARDNGADEVVLFEYITSHSNEITATIVKDGKYDYRKIKLYEDKQEVAVCNEIYDLDE